MSRKNKEKSSKKARRREKERRLRQFQAAKAMAWRKEKIAASGATFEERFNEVPKDDAE